MEALDPLTHSNPNPHPQHYYSGDKYYSSSQPNLYQYSATKYDGGAANNRKHYRQKVASKSVRIPSSSSSSSHESHPLDNGSVYSASFFQNSLHMMSESLSSLHHNSKNYYLRDDLSSNNSDIDVIGVIDEEDDDDGEGVRLVDSSSNCSFDTMGSGGATPITRKIMEENKEDNHHPLMGMILVTLSALMYAGLNLSVKVLMFETPWQELMFIRMGITWMATCIWIVVQFKGKMKLFGPKEARALLFIRAFFLWGAMFTCWWSFEYLPVGDGTTLAMSFPVWVSVFAHFVWRNNGDSVNASSQRLDLFGWICVLSGLLGIAFVAQPSFIFGTSSGDDTSRRDIGIIIGICSAICAGAQYVIVNYTKKNCHWLQVEQVTAALSTFILCPLGFVAFALANWQSSGHFTIGWMQLDAARWAEEIACGLLGFFALALLTRGSQLDAPARTAICLYLEIPFVYIGQSFMDHAIPNVYVWVGIVLVLASVIVPAVRKMRRAIKQKEIAEKLRQRLDIDGDETMPLIEDAAAHQHHAPSVGTGVTVEWSSEDSDEDIDVDGIYNGNVRVTAR